MTKMLVVTAFLVSLLQTGAVAQDHSKADEPGPYAGFQTRDIKSLSEQDIAELRRGGGWGLALPAELNGRPGPAHLLELQEQVELSPAQVEAIEAVYDALRADAIAAGERFIAAEAALSNAFQDPQLDETRLRRLIDSAAEARADLRMVHLSQHLTTPGLLTSQQVRKYNVLRGYADDPCANVPEGHDPELWRRHNGCG